MKESDWLALASPLAMLRAIAASSNRKFILTCVASAREIAKYLDPDDFSDALQLAEQRADGEQINLEDYRRIDWLTEGAVFSYDSRWIDIQPDNLPAHLVQKFLDTEMWINNHASGSSLAYFVYEAMLVSGLADLERYGKKDYINPAHVIDVFGNVIANRPFPEKWQNTIATTC